MILQRKINDERKRSYHHFRTANHHFILITNKALNRFMAIKGFSLSFILSSNKKDISGEFRITRRRAQAGLRCCKA